MKSQMKFNLQDKKRILAVLIAVILMGFSLSFLIRLNFGTDPCSCMNLGISNQLGLSFGTWQVILNCMLFLIVFMFDRSLIGWGTLANMILVGYTADFFKWFFDLFLPTGIFSNLGVRILVLIPSLILFIIAAAVYMSVDLGTAPYDATVFLLASKIKFLPFRAVRICWDLTACLIGFLAGTPLGIVTIAMAFLLGPVIAKVKSKIDNYFSNSSITS